MRIILLSSNSTMASEWRRRCSHSMGVVFGPVTTDFAVVVNGAEAIVSPGNSYGFMDGGFDRGISATWPGAEAKVKAMINEEWAGELPVGAAGHVHLGKAPGIKGAADMTLIVAPTMRSPEPLPRDTLAPYLAARAALLCARKLQLTSIALPAFGNGVGRVSAAMVAHQVSAAILGFRSGRAAPTTWREAVADTAALRTPRP